jgi:hypothetical protein
MAKMRGMVAEQIPDLAWWYEIVHGEQDLAGTSRTQDVFSSFVKISLRRFLEAASTR